MWSPVDEAASPSNWSLYARGVKYDTLSARTHARGGGGSTVTHRHAAWATRRQNNTRGWLRTAALEGVERRAALERIVSRMIASSAALVAEGETARSEEPAPLALLTGLRGVPLGNKVHYDRPSFRHSYAGDGWMEEVMEGKEEKWEGSKHGFDNPKIAFLDLRKGSSGGILDEKSTFSQTIPKWSKSGLGVI